MKLTRLKQAALAAFSLSLVAVVGSSAGANALSYGSQGQYHPSNYTRHASSTWWRHGQREISRWDAMRIARSVFPYKRIASVQLHGYGWYSEYQVRFTDGSRVDVRKYGGQVTYARNAYHHHRYYYQR